MFKVRRAGIGAKVAALALSLTATCAGLGIGLASASAALPYQFDANLSLAGDCTVTGFDPTPDPGCPYPPSPNAPTARFIEPRSIAVDLYGNEYVASYGNENSGWTGAGQSRIDVFDDEGFFLTEFGAGAALQSITVDSQGNVYAWEDRPGGNKPLVRYSPTVYEPEAGNIAYGGKSALANPPFFAGLTIDKATDRLLVAEMNGISEYGSIDEGNAFLGRIENPKIRDSLWPSVDAERRRLYVGICREERRDCAVLVLDADAPHEVLAEIDGAETPLGGFLGDGRISVAVNEANGHFFVDNLMATKNVYEFDENYRLVATLTFAGFQGGNYLQIGVANVPENPTAANAQYLFVPALAPRNAAFAFKPPGVTPPEISGAAALAVAETEAELMATVDPNGGTTEYKIEYVSEAAFDVDGFADAQVVAEGTIPGSALPRRVSAHITGLTAGAGYRFRVSAENESDSDEEEAAFATYADADAGGACANQTLRGPAALRLPDCRAYELVSPPDTQGHPVRGMGSAGDRFNTLQSSPQGSSVSYAVAGGVLPGFEGTGGINGDPYLAARGTAGWATSAVGPSGAEVIAVRPGSASPDQGFRFWAGVFNTSGNQLSSNFVRYPDGHSALVGRGSLASDERAKGTLITEGGTHIVFATRNLSGGNLAKPLEPNAPPLGTEAVYDRTADEQTHVVSLLPGNVPPAPGENAVYLAASPDGNGIAFSIGNRLFLRVDNAVTYLIGEGVKLAGISEGGDRVFYVDDGDLLAFDTSTEAVVPFAESGDATVVNVAVDGTRAYFVSASVLIGAANPNGAVAQPGGQNLYLSEEGQLRFVATVTTRDVQGKVEPAAINAVDGLGLWTEALAAGQLSRDPSRLTPDGRVMIFQSRANLDGGDSGGVPQIYRYDSAGPRLHCVSCQPTGQAGGGASMQSYSEEPLGEIPLEPDSFTPNITPDGGRAFFESLEALVSYDTDGRRDVYEWEEGGVGSCTRAGGCVYLISSPQSENDEYLFGQSRDGDDVFFVSGDALAGGDAGGTPSLYDARVGGGYPEAVVPDCSGEGCRPGLTMPPPLAVPESGARSTDGNVTPQRHKTCPKGKRKVVREGKARCVAKHGKKSKAKQAKKGKKGKKGKKHRNRAGTTGRAGR